MNYRKMVLMTLRNAKFLCLESAESSMSERMAFEYVLKYVEKELDEIDEAIAFNNKQEEAKDACERLEEEFTQYRNFRDQFLFELLATMRGNAQLSALTDVLQRMKSIGDIQRGMHRAKENMAEVVRCPRCAIYVKPVDGESCPVCKLVL